MRDRNIVQFVGICMGAEEEGIPDEAMLVGRGCQGQPGGTAGLQSATLTGTCDPWPAVFRGLRLPELCSYAQGFPAASPLLNRPATRCLGGSRAAQLRRPAGPEVVRALRPLRPSPHLHPKQIQEFMEAGSLFQALKWRDQEGRRVFGW